MTPDFINQKEEYLLNKKKELERDLSEFAEKTSKNNWETKYPQMNSSEEDKVDEIEEYENTLPVERSLEEKLKDVNDALEKIEKGEYGKCSECGAMISEDRLNILPEARTCDICKCKDSECAI